MVPDKPEWKLSGQMVSFTLPLSETVANLKAKLQEETNMAPAKQKLFFDVSTNCYLAKGEFELIHFIVGDVL